MSQLPILKLVLKWFAHKPATRLYPFEKRDPYKNTRGSIVIDIETCTMCTLCERKCPSKAISVKKTERIWSIDRLSCVQCAACIDACPKKCLSMNTVYSPVTTEKKWEVFKQQKPPAPAKQTPETVTA
ncbi:MAG: 4Fe-4S binding protein [Chitinivibrionales bacterium]|nr:4Fe-4S binding protein [Chitinivibrionales bacterium]